MGFPGDSVVKNLPANAGDEEETGSVPGSGRYPGEENGNSLQYSCLRNTMNRAAWQATVHWGHKRVGDDLTTKQQLAMTSIFSCASWPPVCLLWRNVCLGLMPIFQLSC